MNEDGAYIIDPKTGDPQKAAGFTTDVTKPQRVSVYGNYSKGFRVQVGDTIKTRRYADPAEAAAAADRIADALGRAT